MPNIHTPQRLAGEPQADYRARRAASRAAVERMTLRGEHTPPGRRSPTSRQHLRDSQRLGGTMGKRMRFADVRMGAWAKRRALALQQH